MIVSTTVLDWRTDGGRRIADKTSGDGYLLNHKNMFEIHTHSDGAWMYYADNRFDRRDNLAYLKCSSTPALLITASDLVPVSEMVTVSVYPDDVLTETPVEMTINIDQISRAWAHKNALDTYLVYTDDAWNLVRVLCDTTLAALYTLISGI